MAPQATADGGTNRITEDLRLADVEQGDRIGPGLIPLSAEIDVGEPVARHLARRDRGDDERTYSVRRVAHGYRDQYQDVHAALVYDPESDRFARLSGHTSSGAMNQAERDWKVRDVGREVVVKDVDADIPDLEDFDQTPREFVEEWVEILIDNLRHGDDAIAIETFDGKSLRLRDADGRTAWVTYRLETPGAEGA